MFPQVQWEKMTLQCFRHVRSASLVPLVTHSTLPPKLFVTSGPTDGTELATTVASNL